MGVHSVSTDQAQRLLGLWLMPPRQPRKVCTELKALAAFLEAHRVINQAEAQRVSQADIAAAKRAASALLRRSDIAPRHMLVLAIHWACGSLGDTGSCQIVKAHLERELNSASPARPAAYLESLVTRWERLIRGGDAPSARSPRHQRAPEPAVAWYSGDAYQEADDRIRQLCEPLDDLEEDIDDIFAAPTEPEPRTFTQLVEERRRLREMAESNFEELVHKVRLQEALRLGVREEFLPWLTPYDVSWLRQNFIAAKYSMKALEREHRQLLEARAAEERAMARILN